MFDWSWWFLLILLDIFCGVFIYFYCFTVYWFKVGALIVRHCFCGLQVGLRLVKVSFCRGQKICDYFFKVDVLYAGPYDKVTFYDCALQSGEEWTEHMEIQQVGILYCPFRSSYSNVVLFVVFLDEHLKGRWSSCVVL